MTFEEYLSSLKGKTVGVIGVGVSNRPLIEKLLERGIDVTARDKKEDLGELGQALTAQGCKLRLGSAYLADLREDVIFRTPGLRPDTPEIAAAVAAGFRDLKLPEETVKRYDELLKMIDELPKYGNDICEIDEFARDVAYTYTKPLEQYRNPRGGRFQAGLYPVSANVPLGAQTGATPDGRLANTPIADGVGPVAGRDVHGPTATANSVSHLDHFIASNGTLFNQKFHPSALSGMEGLQKFIALIRSFFDQKGMHMQFNVVSRETLLDAQAHPENYKNLVVRVAGYSALFTTLSRSLQDDIINRTTQGF